MLPILLPPRRESLSRLDALRPVMYLEVDNINDVVICMLLLLLSVCCCYCCCCRRLELSRDSLHDIDSGPCDGHSVCAESVAKGCSVGFHFLLILVLFEVRSQDLGYVARLKNFLQADDQAQIRVGKRHFNDRRPERRNDVIQVGVATAISRILRQLNKFLTCFWTMAQFHSPFLESYLSPNHCSRRSKSFQIPDGYKKYVRRLGENC